MALNEVEQIRQLLEDKKHILITFHKDGQGGAIGASVALALWLEKMGKRADIVAHNFSLPKAYQFLKKAEEIQPAFSCLQKFIISIGTEKNGIQELSYDLKDQKLRIFVTPKQGSITKDEITTSHSDFKYDLIFVLNTPDLLALGQIYENNNDLFFKRPIINLDYQITNEHFGQVNIVDNTAVSIGEVVHNLLEQIGNEYLDKDIATALLTSIIAQTRSFKTTNIKPHTLALAGKLMNLGADRDHIVQNLYRNRSINTLKLWGRALTHLQQDIALGLVWTSVSSEDLIATGVNTCDLYEIENELISNSPEAKLRLFFYEDLTSDNEKPHIHVILNTNKEHNALEILKLFNPTGNKFQASAILTDCSLENGQEKVIDEIRRHITTL